MPSFTRILFPALLLLAGQALAADEPQVPNTAPPPTPSERAQEQIEPEVNIIQNDDKTIEEYRVNGKLYMIKVTPKGAPAYYLIDTDGDGSLDSRPSEIEPDLLIPSWILFRW
ncbi:uncharacterized protein DUF2782 [Thiogranum longum]|uniref:Uncharacterized protein DUF2782 n=1 Tax=Thiogranum longum TaxID=1537524 RepID=A0A4V2PGI4_9GAMM|nr:DUF2782 domain-containing protein [Thiogranum longum]TCK16946.1 uncharacterized protein DUF2782 [Thiogranum longum]